MFHLLEKYMRYLPQIELTSVWKIKLLPNSNYVPDAGKCEEFDLFLNIFTLTLLTTQGG